MRTGQRLLHPPGVATVKIQKGRGKKEVNFLFAKKGKRSTKQRGKVARNVFDGKKYTREIYFKYHRIVVLHEKGGTGVGIRETALMRP